MPPPPPSPSAARTPRLSAAGAQHAQQRALALTAGPDPSMALRSDIASLSSAVAAAEEYAEFGINSNTATKDERAWVFWEDVCERQGANPLRTAADARDFPQRNAHLLVCLLLYAFAVCTPTDKSRLFIKPRSALAYPLAIIRVFARWGVVMPGFKMLQATLHGTMRMYLAYHGPHSLAPKRAEPMRFDMVRRIIAIAVDGCVTIGTHVWVDTCHAVFIFRRLVAFMIYTAFRLGEIVAHSSGEIMFLTRSSVKWRINGVIVSEPTRAQMLGLRPGVDSAFVSPPRSKPDQWGEVHCPFPVHLTFTFEADNAAAALRDIQLRSPCAGELRDTTPLFADERGLPYTLDSSTASFAWSSPTCTAPRSRRSTRGTRSAAVWPRRSTPPMCPTQSSCSSAGGCAQSHCTSTAG
mgnify:CR=1 FL=1